MINRVILIVLDGFGIGELPDAKQYNDEGSNTLLGIYDNVKLDLKNMKKLGLYNIDEIQINEKENNPIGIYGRAKEKSAGKNSPVGHWEIAGFIKEKPFKTYPNAFPQELLKEFIESANLNGILCNKKGSGTELLKQYGEEHMKTGFPIIYTSADSVFQIAAHEDIIPVERLYKICETVRKIVDNPKYDIGTVIARPFVGNEPSNFIRTYNRKDYESKMFDKTMLDIISDDFGKVVAIGKIQDLFVGRGITNSIHTQGNLDGIIKTIENIKKDTKGLIFTNLLDFDMLYGHRNDIKGYAKSLEQFDSYIPEIINSMKETDMLIITADHGNDPSTPSTDHSREYVPILIYGKNLKQNINIGTRQTFSDISATILDVFGLEILQGKSFRKSIEV